MFSRISEALKRVDATTLEALRRLISSSYTPHPSTVHMENIYDFKTWIRPFVATFQNHGSPHVFRFTKNERGEVEMVYRLLAGGEGKEWLSEEPFVIMTEMPQGFPSLLKPDNKKNATPEEMERALEHLKSRLTVADSEWWKTFVAKEKENRELWEGMTEDEYQEAGESFDIRALQFNPEPLEEDDEDEDILRAEAAILQQLNKEHRPVRWKRWYTAFKLKHIN